MYLARQRNDTATAASLRSALNALSTSFASTHLYNYNSAPGAVPRGPVAPSHPLPPPHTTPHTPAAHVENIIFHTANFFALLCGIFFTFLYMQTPSLCHPPCALPRGRRRRFPAARLAG